VDAVARFRAGSEANDMDQLVTALAPSVELISPISGRMVFRGPDDLRVLLGAVYGTIKGLRWTEEVGDEHTRVVIGDCRVGPLRLGEAMILDLAPDGQIERIRPHLRPWLPLTLFALLLGPKVARNPGLVWRGLHSGSR
jgi:hypothetical protein